MITRLILTVFLGSFFISAAVSGVKDEVREVAREKSKLSRQVGKLFRELKLNENEGYAALEKNAFEASQLFTKTRKAHPALKEAYAKSDAAQSRMVKASLARDKEAKKIAMDDYTTARMELESSAKKIPELTEVKTKAIEANEAVQEKKKELLATTPEGSALIGQINALEEKIIELRKKL